MLFDFDLLKHLMRSLWYDWYKKRHFNCLALTVEFTIVIKLHFWESTAICEGLNCLIVKWDVKKLCHDIYRRFIEHLRYEGIRQQI